MVDGRFVSYRRGSTAKQGHSGLGLEAQRRADMRVVDLYREEGGKLSENWIFIDVPHYLNMQGLDVLGRMEGLSEPWLDA